MNETPKVGRFTSVFLEFCSLECYCCLFSQQIYNDWMLLFMFGWRETISKRIKEEKIAQMKIKSKFVCSLFLPKFTEASMMRLYGIKIPIYRILFPILWLNAPFFFSPLAMCVCVFSNDWYKSWIVWCTIFQRISVCLAAWFWKMDFIEVFFSFICAMKYVIRERWKMAIVRNMLKFQTPETKERKKEKKSNSQIWKKWTLLIKRI